MNNLLNTLNAMASTTPAPITPGNAADGTAALASGGSGAFAQLLGSFTRTPAAIPPVAGADSAATPATAQSVGSVTPALASIPAILPDETFQPKQTEEAAAAPQPDAALIAALLGQMQTPYVLPAPDTEVHIRVSIPTAALAPAPASEPALAPDAPVTAEATNGQQPPALRSYAAAASPFAADFVTPEAASTDQVPAARQSPVALPPQAAAAIATVTCAPVQGDTLRPTDNEAHSGDGVRSASSGAVSMDNADHAPRPALSQPHADSRRALELNPVAYEQEATALIVAAPTTPTGSATQAHSFAFKQPRDRSGDVATVAVAGGTPATIATRGDTLAPQAGIAPHLGSPEWQPAFANSVKLLVNEGSSAATLQLNPAEFGPIDVRIVITDQRADISFMVTHPDANAAIQAALVELRDQLAQSGIQLGQTSVGAHPQDPRHPPGAPQRGVTTGPVVVTPPAGAQAPERPRSQGTIDIYA